MHPANNHHAGCSDQNDTTLPDQFLSKQTTLTREKTHACMKDEELNTN